MVAINSLTMLFFYGPLGGFLLGVGRLPVPWQALLLSISIYVALPLLAGYLSRKWVIKIKGEEWFNDKFLHLLTPVSIIALLITLVLLFSFKGDFNTSINNCTTYYSCSTVFFQGRYHHFKTVNNTLDCNTALYPDKPYFLDYIWPGKSIKTKL